MLSSISSGISRTPASRVGSPTSAPLARVIDLTDHRTRLGLDPQLDLDEPELYITPELLAAIAGSALRE